MRDRENWSIASAIAWYRPSDGRAILRFVEQKCVKLPDPLARWLESESEASGISEGEIVRRALDDYRERRRRAGIERDRRS